MGLKWTGALAWIRVSCDSDLEPDAPVPIRCGVYETMGRRTWREPGKAPELSPCLIANICVESMAHVTVTGARPSPGLRPLRPCSLRFMREGLGGSKKRQEHGLSHCLLVNMYKVGGGGRVVCF